MFVDSALPKRLYQGGGVPGVSTYADTCVTDLAPGAIAKVMDITEITREAREELFALSVMIVKLSWQNDS